MTKADLIAAIAGKSGVTKGNVELVLDALRDVSVDLVAKGEQVNLPGFGRFALKETAARTGRNPLTGEPINIAAKRSIRFKAAKGAEDRLNQSA